MNRCKQTTLKGDRCKIKIKHSSLCWLHLKKLSKFQHFIDAQDSDYETAKSELLSGGKKSHWIWYIFPQLEGLGKSAMSIKYAIKDQNEAEEYMRVSILKKRYVALVKIVYDWLVIKKLPPHKLFGPDVKKLRSSLQLFGPILKSKKIDSILKVL